jgi:hypothetical protein
MLLLSCVSVSITLLGQPAATSKDAFATSDARLDFMKKAVATNDIRALDDRGTTIRLQAEPVLRFTNPVGGSKDGALFLWLGEGDRPAVASQILWTPQQIWAQEFSSLSTVPLNAKSAGGRVWAPSKSGVSFQRVPDAPTPADTAGQRLRQLRDLADAFSAEHFYRGKTWNKLRLLTRPLARYGAKGAEAQDGGLFCFVHGTDPEVLLMLESRQDKHGPEWRYAFAPMTGFALNTFWKGKPIWSKPAEGNGSARNPQNTFHIRRVLVDADK